MVLFLWSFSCFLKKYVNGVVWFLQWHLQFWISTVWWCKDWKCDNLLTFFLYSHLCSCSGIYSNITVLKGSNFTVLLGSNFKLFTPYSGPVVNDFSSILGKKRVPSFIAGYRDRYFLSCTKWKPWPLLTRFGSLDVCSQRYVIIQLVTGSETSTHSIKWKQIHTV